MAGQLGKVLTIDNLMARGMPIPNMCSMCCSDTDLVAHVFLHCQVAHSLWSFFISRFRRGWIIYTSMWQLLEDGVKGALPTYLIEASCYGEASLLLCYELIWQERNCQVFENSALDLWMLLIRDISQLHAWLSHLQLFLKYPWYGMWNNSCLELMGIIRNSLQPIREGL